MFYYAGCVVPQSSSQQKTSAPAVTHSCSWCQVTCELIERGILVLPQSRTPALPRSMSIYYANGMSEGPQEQFFNLDI